MNVRAIRRFVAYYRVSTDRQGRSGLGLEAQQKAVADYLNGGAWELVGEYVEVESGKKSDRPELACAMEACRRHKARLVIAKLDRLSRNQASVATLMESGVEFVAADMPFANKLTIHILAAVAEHEREAISERPKRHSRRQRRARNTFGNASSGRRGSALRAKRLRNQNAWEKFRVLKGRAKPNTSNDAQPSRPKGRYVIRKRGRQ
jgi:DNA invertase Pin-like site-specific DNA recombinase